MAARRNSSYSAVGQDREERDLESHARRASLRVRPSTYRLHRERGGAR